MSDTDPKPDDAAQPQDDVEAAAVWARLAPHAKKSFAEALDDYFADSGDNTGDTDKGDGNAGAGGAAAAGGSGGAGDKPKTPAKAQSQGPDVGQQLSDFFFGKRKA